MSIPGGCPTSIAHRDTTDMYRYILLLLLGSAAAAPQLPDIDYLQIRPLVTDISENQPSTHVPLTESYPQSTRTLSTLQELTTKQLTEISTPSQDLTTELSENATDTTETSETTTKPYELVTAASARSHDLADSVLGESENYETIKAPAKFIPKLSYFAKNNEFADVTNNLVEKPYKRRFRSNCRCERIWNCPKLQITVPRCPTEYFMCCF